MHRFDAELREFIHQLSDKLANRGQMRRQSKPVTGVPVCAVVSWFECVYLPHVGCQCVQWSHGLNVFTFLMLVASVCSGLMVECVYLPHVGFSQIHNHSI